MPDGCVTAGRYEWRMEADLARSRLAAAGIPSWIPDDSMSSICWHYAKALGGIRLQVTAEDAEDARSILSENPGSFEEPVLSASEALADRTLRAAVFGCFYQFPIGLYAAWLLVRLLTTGEPLDARAGRKALLAAILMVPALGPLVGLAVWRLL